MVKLVSYYHKKLTSNDKTNYRAAKWALTQTDDEVVRHQLNQYIASMAKGVNVSVENGVKIVFFVRHEIVFQVIDGHSHVFKDTFSDKTNDNGEGYDNIRWTGQEFERYKPDWRQFPDYEMYLTPIEDIGRALLIEYQAFPQDILSQSTEYVYNYEAAVDYIVQYTSNPDFYSYCNWEPHVVLDGDCSKIGKIIAKPPDVGVASCHFAPHVAVQHKSYQIWNDHFR